MYFAKCPVCGKGISAEAETCPHCGLSLKEYYKEFEIKGDELIRYDGKCQHIVVPDGVKRIGDHAFSHCEALSITLPESVTTIGMRAFIASLNLKSVYIPDSVTDIGKDAFFNCVKLEDIVIPGRLTVIDDCVFGGCDRLDITIPKSIKRIGVCAFSQCGFRKITIPNGVTVIDESAFSSCCHLKSVHIPASVTHIGTGAFSRRNRLKKITVAKDNPVYHSAGNCLIETASGTLVLGAEKSVIPNDGSIIIIGEEAFFERKGLKYITIPNSVTEIANNAFSYCDALSELTIPKSVAAIGERAFNNCSALKRINVEKGNPAYHSSGDCLIETDTKKLIRGSKNSVIPGDGSVTSINECAFDECADLGDVIIPEYVTDIGDYAFCFCKGLKSVTFAGAVDRIGKDVFDYCEDMTSVTFANGVSELADGAFSHCSALTDIYYNGTKEQWTSVKKDDHWNFCSGEYTVHCADGDIKKG